MNQNLPKEYDLQKRTFAFASQVRALLRGIKLCGNSSDIHQLCRSSGSVGANYIEAQEACSEKDFLYRVRICRKEAKESAFWLQLLLPYSTNINFHEQLIQEAGELVKIFSAIILSKERKKQS